MHAVIFIPEFDLQAVLRLEPELYLRPAALIDVVAKKPVVSQLTPTARGAGIAEGMTAPQATARCATIALKSRNTALEATARELLLQCAGLFSPRLEDTAKGICTLDLKGLGAAGNEEWGGKVLGALGQVNLRARLGVAENPGLALLAARCAQPFLRVENSREFVSALPIEALEPSEELLPLFRKWGLRTVGDLTALKREDLAERLSPEGLQLYEQALAREQRPLKLVQPSERFREEMDFENPVESLEPLLFVLRRFIDQITRRLELVYLVALEICLTLRLESGDNYQRSFRVPAPTRDADVLFRMLHTHLEGLRTEHPISGVSLEAMPCGAAQHQFNLFETALRDPNRFFETVSRLGALLGKDRVGSPRLAKTHKPDVFSMEPPSLETEEEKSDAAETSVADGMVLRRHRPPMPAEVELEGNRPVRLRTTRFTGRIKAACGPWQLSGDWWDNGSWRREEWDVQIERGEMCRIYREEKGWFVDGTYD